MVVHERAYAKLNLVLQVGRPRSDGMHPLCSLFASIELADELEGCPAELDEDSVECAGVEGENLALGAIGAFRERTGGLPDGPVRLRIDKHIPVAAGLGGGSADAAAALRIVNRISGLPLDASRSPGAGRAARRRRAEPDRAGARARPGRRRAGRADRAAAARGRVGPERGRPSHRRGLCRARPAGRRARAARRRRRSRELAAGAPDRLGAALENDLERAALALRPELAGTLAQLRSAGALGAAVSGSGPTCFGLFADRPAAEAAAAAVPGAIVSPLRRG